MGAISKESNYFLRALKKASQKDSIQDEPVSQAET